MNILPKKRWHVRTKENIARVRRDEALAAEQERIEQARIEKAESEARINFLRHESRKKNNITESDVIDTKSEPIQSQSNTSKHINFFEELEKGSIDYVKTNKDYEKEKKEEQEKYEKQIGYLTYLGQGIKESVSKCWYNEVPKRINDTEKDVEIKPNKKVLEDPMQDIKRYLKIISFKKSDKPAIKLETSELISNSDKKHKLKLKEEGLNSVSRKRKHKSSDDDSSDDNHKSHKRHKKHKKHKKSKKHKHDKVKDTDKPSVSIEKLRAERLEREKREKLRAQALLAELKGGSDSKEESAQPMFRQKYNSQFFPQLARQNCEKNYR